MRKLVYLIILFSLGAFAQHDPKQSEPETLMEIFKNSHVHGHVRNYFMNTANQGELRDYYTNALGGAIAIKTAPYKGFEIGIKGIFTYKTFSADLNEPDSTTGQVSKWEHELYDINDLDNFNDLDRLEQLYLRYNFKDGYATYGKMEIEDTPLLNESDGRMKPFAFKGLWLNYQIKDHHFNLSWLDRVSPRSTVEWYSFQEALGLTNNGFQPNGEVAEYAEHLESEGIAMLQYETAYKDFDLQVNHWYLHRVMNTSMLLLDWHKNDFHLGLQYALQLPDNAQKELEYDNRYLQPGERGQVFSTKAGLNKPHWKLDLAYTHAFDTGRFLFPRELGRDHFFTSISRSRLEGFGDVDVLTISGGTDLKIDRFYIGAEFTTVFGAEVDDFQFNKYNLDEYYQLNTHLHYELDGFLEGLKLDLLYVYKENTNNTDPETIFNTSNFHQLNFVVNYDF